MNDLQDKELQSYAFEIYKNKSISVDYSYKLAKEFLSEKRNKDNLEIIPNDSILIQAVHSFICYKEVFVDFSDSRKNEFQIPPLRFTYVSEDYNTKKVLDYVLSEVNKQLRDVGCITGSVEVELTKRLDK